MKTTFQTYDPTQLVRDVTAHLHILGLDAEVQDGKNAAATRAACELLTALGITPALDGVAALIRSSEKAWSETD